MLKDIVELVVSHIHTEETICYLDSKISEHRHRFLQVFPQEKIIPKLHFLEHYPQLIRDYGPLVFLWTMCFETKHSLFKRIVRHTHCCQNILLSMAVKYQLMIACNQHGPSVARPVLQATQLSTVDVTVLRADIRIALEVNFPRCKFKFQTKCGTVAQSMRSG